MGIAEALLSCVQWILRMMDPGSDDGLGADNWLDSMRGDREWLQRLLNLIQATLQDARLQIESGSMTLQLKELEGLAADLEDLLDDFEYEELRLRVEGGGGNSGADYSLLEQPNQGSVRDVMVASRIAEIRRRFDDIKTDWEFFKLLPESDEGATTQMKAHSRETSSLPTNTEVLGRDRVKGEIIEFLVGGAEERLSVVAIVGIGGVGKTTLARFIYNDEKISGHFNPKIWVHVSCDFDVKNVTRQILERVAGPQSNLHQMSNLDVLQTGLAATMKDKNFLLVLDDMWYEDQTIDNVKRWDALCAPLLWGGKGSKILVTTRRAQVVVGSRQPLKTIELKGLEFEASWSLFEKHAFVDDGNSGRHPNLEKIGKRIVSKLRGVPLAVVTVGSMLYSESEESRWTSVLNSELWELEQGEGGILPALRLSYERLPAHLKPCFAHFSAFQKGLKFEKPELLQLWMASGHIKSQGRKRAEDIGNDYLSCLLSRSLVQSADDKYSVHDLLYDLARSILPHDSCHTEIDQLHRVPEEDQQKHHLSLRINRRPALCELEKLQGFRKLRTCAFGFSYKGDFQIPCSLFENLSCLRVLDLSYGGMQVLPDSIGSLRRLRYLDLRKTPIRYLPDSLCTLYMLQTLKLQGCDQLSRLPDGISNLINLRHLEARPELISGISGFGKLAHIQQLAVFGVSEGDGIKIRDLREMDELRGKLCKQNLQRVVSKEEACVANLTNKKYISKLKLEWVEDGDVNQKNSEFEEADALLPPPNLKGLAVVGYGGSGFPTWMEHCGLECISLSRCRRWGALPPLTAQLSTLRKLKISGLPQLTELPPLPSTLTDLRLIDVGLNRVSELQNLHQLNHLCLFCIPNLRELPPLPTTLKTLGVINLGLETLPDFCQDHKGQGGEGWDGKGPSLVSLSIVGCQNLRSLGGVLRHHLLYLDHLSIEDCEELMSWPEEEEGFRATLESLQVELRIKDCPKLLPLPVDSVLPPSLKNLKVKRCPRFVDRSLFAQIQNLHTALTKSGDLHVEKQYQDLKSCSEEALQQVNHPIRLLIIRFIDLDINEGSACSFIFFRYCIHNRRAHGLSSEDYPLLSLEIHDSRRNISNGGVDHNRSTLFTCLRLLHHRCSSLHSLCISGVPNSAFLIEQGVGGGGGEAVSSSGENLLFLDWLEIEDCRDMGRLPVETLLCYLRQLKTLVISNCPELTLASVEEAMRFLPSLRRLKLFDCPRMSEEVDLVSDANNSGGCSSSSSSSSSSSTSTSPPPQLRVLCTDNIAIPSNWKFARDCLTSLEAVGITVPKVKSFPAGRKHDGEWPRSIRWLHFICCPDLEELPPSLGRLVPSLKILWIEGCPKLRCVPERGLPPSLELLNIRGSPGVAEADWPKVAHVRIICHDLKFLRGSSSDFDEVVSMLSISDYN